VTTPAVAPFAEALGLFDRVLVIDDRSWPRLLASSLKAWAGCLGSDTVVDLEVYSMLTTVFSLFTLARNRIGFYLHTVFWRLPISTHLVFFNRFSGGYHFYDQIAGLLGAEPATPEECRLQLARGLSPAAKPARGPARRIGIGHSCSDLARERMLTPAQWRSVLEERRPRETPVELHFFGVSPDRADAEEIIRALPEADRGLSFINHCGENNLKETIALIAGLDEYWGIDSALLHVARVLGIPCLSFWGPTDPAGYLRPFAGLKETVLYEKISCSPCVHIAETPPCRGNNLCIQRLFKEGASLPENPTWVVKAAG
jgi:ADP-heptose:LPS heptosyltransferase